MYKVKVGSVGFNIPKKNSRLLAISNAMDLQNCNTPLDTEEQAIEYLRSIGIEVANAI